MSRIAPSRRTRFVALVPCAIGACLSAAGCDGSTEPGERPDARPIVYFRSDVSSGPTLYRTTASGSAPVRIDVGQRTALYPSLSPDGTVLAFFSESEPTPGLWIAAADGAGAHRIAATETGDHIAWSPDGTRLAVAIGGEILVMNADGGNLHSVTTAVDVPAHYPAWSRDDRIAFATGDFFHSAIYTIALDGSDLQLVMERENYELRDPAWSPDGSRLAFAGIWFGGSSIFTVDEKGGEVRRITPDPSWGFWHTDLGPAWSPSGRWIAFQREHSVCDGPSCASRWDVFIVPTDGGELRNLTGATKEGGVRPTW